MNHAEKCPICYGTGKIKKKTCHGCGGKGWIEVSNGRRCWTMDYPFIKEKPKKIRL